MKAVRLLALFIELQVEIVLKIRTMRAGQDRLNPRLAFKGEDTQISDAGYQFTGCVEKFLDSCSLTQRIFHTTSITEDSLVNQGELSQIADKFGQNTAPCGYAAEVAAVREHLRTCLVNEANPL